MTSLSGSPPLDILIRTSGVKRLSDYMMWQVSSLRAHLPTHTLTNPLLQCSEDTQLQFSNTYWPEFGMFDFVPIILDYQRRVWARP